jgi:hypothetical protein
MNNSEQKEFLNLLSNVHESDIVGLVDASGSRGYRKGGSQQWHLVINMAAWKDRAGVMHKEMLRVELPVSYDELSRYRENIVPYNIIHLKGRVAAHPAGRMQSLATCIVTTHDDDPELREYAAELQQPVVIKDPLIGEFTLDRSINCFKGHGKWQGKKIKMYLSVDADEFHEELFDTARTLWKHQREWSKRIQDYSVDRLLELKNDNWLEEGEQKVSPKNFKKRITLKSVNIYPGGHFEFWYDDGDLFWGHAIQVSGSLADGLTDADIPG